MVRQARSEMTRRKIITAAVDLFSEAGYPVTGLGDIIERAEMTKGALYYHFDSKESLAAAIVEEGVADLFATFHNISESSSPAMENIIHGIFVVADRVDSDRSVRVSVQLLRLFGGFSDTAKQSYHLWLTEIAKRVDQAREEGDLRAGLDTRAVTETIVGAMVGAELLSSAASDDADLHDRVTRVWQVLLPAIVSDESQDYFREFLARESLRRSPPE